MKMAFMSFASVRNQDASLAIILEPVEGQLGLIDQLLLLSDITCPDRRKTD